MPSQAMTVMGFDFGTKRIGTAIGESLLGSAKPLNTVDAVNGEPTWLQVDELVKRWRPDLLVVGVPLKIDGTELFTTHLARRFIKQLRRRFKLPVEPVDERLTTKAAREIVFEEGGYKSLQKAEIDSIAAKLIVEQWFENKE